jgi:hypothetical protein
MQRIQKDLQRCKALLSVDNGKLGQITNVRCPRLKHHSTNEVRDGICRCVQQSV